MNIGESWALALSLFDIPRVAPKARTIRAYCMFIGHPRSGHSLVGSLLNAHPNIVIAHELHALRYLGRIFTRHQLFALLLRQDRRFERLGRKWEGYDYNVPGLWQGRFDRLEVIGDKKGGGTTRALALSPELLGQLRDKLRLPLRIIHHVRNPYDNIATISKRTGKPTQVAARRYFRQAAMNRRLLENEIRAEETIESHHEDLIADPEKELARLVRFLGVEPDEDYLRACAQHIFERPKITRFDVEWPQSVHDDVAREIDKYDSLRRYSFSD